MMAMMKMSRNQNTDRQLKASVSQPAMIGPRMAENPRPVPMTPTVTGIQRRGMRSRTRPYSRADRPSEMPHSARPARNSAQVVVSAHTRHPTANKTPQISTIRFLPIRSPSLPTSTMVARRPPREW